MHSRGLIALLFLLYFVHTQADEKSLQGQDLLRADIMAVFAHPDDETGMAPTLAYYSQVQAKRVVAVYATRGEGGGNMVGRQWGPSLGILRERELQQCLERLGVERHYFLGQRDWAYTESAQMTLEAWDRNSALEQLVRLIRLCRPEILLTMNPTPNPGQHGHHQAAGILAVEAFDLAGRAEAYSAQIEDEGIDPWQVKKLYITAAPDPFGATIASTFEVPGGKGVGVIAGEALSFHRSQGFGNMNQSPWLSRPRSYRLIRSFVGFQKDETDLLAGTQGEVSGNGKLSYQSVEEAFRFESLPAWERFRKWTQDQGVGFLFEKRPAQSSIPAGQSSLLRVLKHSGGSVGWSDLRIELPEGWIGEWVKEGVPNHSDARLFKVIPPVHESKGNLIRAYWMALANHQESQMEVKVVPYLEVTKGDQTVGFEDFFRVPHGSMGEIGSDKLWQGEVIGEEDNSGRFWVRYDDEAIWIVVEVMDDVVVSNIASNDIRGHWRSDSVEICLDPQAGSEHTLGCFKVGIFPFDVTGKVRAARDADANQGPIERTAPGMKLRSERSEHGYRIGMAIPWSVVGLAPETGKLLGFNVLLYDGDKRDASLGENINKSRLAWSAERGVQGRPEDWGRIRLR